MAKQPLALHIFAILIAVAVATGLFFWLKDADFNSSPKLTAIGEITHIDGRLDHRLPGSHRTQMVPAPPQPLHHQELLITQRASTADLYFSAAETAVRLHEGTRFVAEKDPVQEGAVIATILDGALTVLQAGKKDRIKFYKSGRELTLKGAFPITLGQTAAPALSAAQPALENESEFKIIVTATTRPAGVIRSEEDIPRPEAGSDILTNDDIIRRLRAQTGFFQRCYLNHIHREQAKSGGSSPGALISTGTIVTSFTIQINGRVSDAKVVRSDFKDAILHSCVTEVLERTTFRGFKGEPVPVREFPISFQ